MDRFQILCLSGGGYRGLYTAKVLSQLETHFGKSVHECFDLICGTSIGGVIATGLAFGKSATEIYEGLLRDGPEIFTNQHGWRKWKAVTSAPYSSEILRSAINKLLPKDAKIKDALVPYITTAINLHTGKPRVFKTPHHELYKIDGHFFACDAALATSAAPLFFSPAKVGSEKFIDGGLYANNPILVGLHEAEHFLEIDVNKIHLLSIGTTGKIAGVGHQERGWGWLDWMRQKLVIELTFSAQQEFVNNIVGHRLGNRLVKIDELCGGGEGFSIAMDDTSLRATEQLEAMASRSIMRAINNVEIGDFFRHEPSRIGLMYNFLKNSEAA